MNEIITEETFDSLWSYCTANNRLCLKPMKWYELFCMLKNVKQNLSDGQWRPSLPLTSSEWGLTEPPQKFLLFQEHLKWAVDNNQLEEVGGYIRAVPETEWVHYWEI